MRYRSTLFCLILILSILTLVASASPAQAETPLTGPDALAVFGVLDRWDSPLPAVTIICYKAAHPQWNPAVYLAVVWCESSLGRNCGVAVNNPGGIKGGPIGSAWRDLRIGVGKRGFNLYRNLYDGQRACIRLLDERYADVLADKNWAAFARVYHGPGAGLARYTRNLAAAYGYIVAEAARYGAKW